jgi:hypothetical protein
MNRCAAATVGSRFLLVSSDRAEAAPKRNQSIR